MHDIRPGLASKKQRKHRQGLMGAWKATPSITKVICEELINCKQQRFCNGCSRVSDLQRTAERGRRRSLYTWMTSDYSHVCCFAETLLELIRAGGPGVSSPSPTRIRAMEQIWPCRCGRRGWLNLSRETDWKRDFFLSVFCCKCKKNSVGLLHLFCNWREYLAFHPPLSEYHTPCLILCVLWGLAYHILFHCVCFIHYALRLIHRMV